MNKESAFEWNLNFHKLEHEFIAKKNAKSWGRLVVFFNFLSFFVAVSL